MYWFYTVLLSILNSFPKVKPRCFTEIRGLPSDWPILQAYQEPISEQEKTEVRWIQERPKGMQKHALTIDLGYADRFLAKLAIGLGHNILGPRATFSSYGDELRKLLWSKNYEERPEIGVHGTGPWGESPLSGVEKFITWPGLWSVLLSRVEDRFCFVLGTPSGKTMSLAMSDDPSLWASDKLDKHAGGALYVIVPQRKRAFGPIPITSLIAHRTGSIKEPQLTQLEALKTDLARIPDRERPTEGEAYF